MARHGTYDVRNRILLHAKVRIERPALTGEPTFVRGADKAAWVALCPLHERPSPRRSLRSAVGRWPAMSRRSTATPVSSTILWKCREGCMATMHFRGLTCEQPICRHALRPSHVNRNGSGPRSSQCAASIWPRGVYRCWCCSQSRVGFAARFPGGISVVGH